METVIVEVFAPAANKTFDFALPAQGRVGEVAAGVAATLEAAEKNISFDAACLLLCDLDGGAALAPGLTVVEAGVRDGSRLMLL